MQELATLYPNGSRRKQSIHVWKTLVKGDDAIFAATGVTDGELLRGVQFKGCICSNLIH